MKNTLTLNVKDGYELEHISNINDGTDRLILMLKCDASSGVNVQNSLGTFSVNADSDLFSVEIPTPLWVGLGTETIRITAGTENYDLTINKTPAAGGNYQLEKVNDTEIRFSKVRDNFPEVFYPDREQIVGTWHNGKPIYRAYVMREQLIEVDSTTFLYNLEALNIDDVVKVDGRLKRTTTTVANRGQIFFAGGLGSSFQVNTTGNGDLEKPQKQLSVQIYYYGYYTVWIEYTKLSDPVIETASEADYSKELEDNYTLAWESDIAATQFVDLPESMTRHKFLGFEVSNAAPTGANNVVMQRIPVSIFKEYYKYYASPNTVFRLSTYDSYYDEVSYVSDTVIRFYFGATNRLRRVWFID